MPPTLRSASSAREHVLSSATKWRAEFAKAKQLKDLAASCATCLDDMTAGQTFSLDSLQKLEANVNRAISLAEKAEQAVKKAASELDGLKDRMRELEAAQKKTDKTVEETSNKQKTNLTKVQQIQLSQAENVDVACGTSQ